MTHDDLVFEALGYHRNVGVDLPSIRAYVKGREKRRATPETDRASLGRLEKAGKTIQVGQKWFLTAAGLKLARGPAIQPEWEPGDPLILLTLLLAGGGQGGDLEHIIGSVDYIDRSFPSMELVHGALNRLASGGLVRARRGRFAVTDKAAEIFAKVEASCRRAVRSRLHGLQRILDCPCCGVTLKKVRWNIVVGETEMQEALARYKRRF